MQSRLRVAEHRVLQRDELPSINPQPVHSQRHDSLRGLLLVGLDLLQFLHPRAFQMAFPHLGIHGLRSEAVLHGQPLRHQFLKQGTVQ